MTEITRSQLEHKLEEYRQHNQDIKRITDFIGKSILFIAAIEIALGFIIFGGFTLRALIFDIVILLLNFVVIMFIFTYKSINYDLADRISISAFFNSLILHFKYKNILKDYSSFIESDKVISDINKALEKENKLFCILSLLELKMGLHLRESDYKNAEKIFNEICSSKQHPCINLEEIKLSYYGTIEDDKKFIEQFESHPEIFRKWSRANLSFALKLVTYNCIYSMAICDYKKALELSKHDIEFYEKQHEYDNYKAMPAVHLFNSAAKQSTAARIHYKLGEYGNANEAVTKAEEIIGNANFIIPQILIDEIADTKEKLSKIPSDID